jgi:hypothetical protein
MNLVVMHLAFCRCGPGGIVRDLQRESKMTSSRFRCTDDILIEDRQSGKDSTTTQGLLKSQYRGSHRPRLCSGVGRKLPGGNWPLGRCKILEN